MVKRIKKKSKREAQSHHGSTKLDGLKFVGIFRWPGAINEDKGEAAVVIDERATESQRGALLRILTGQDTELGATVCCVQIATRTICSSRRHPI